MFHHVARARAGQLLFTDWQEGLSLWRCVLRAVPGPVALCVMPNHVHLLARTPVSRRLGVGLGAFAMGWNARHGCKGPLFARSACTEAVERTKQRRVHRYVNLNPCRAGLVRDPLSWPLSTLLDEVGLADDPARQRVDDVHGHYAYTVADDRVRAGGLPVADGGDVAVERLLRAVSHAARVPLWEVTARQGRARTLAILAARTLNGWGVRETARQLGVARSTVGDVEIVADRGVDRVARLAASTATDGLDDLVLRRAIAQSRYSRLRPPPRRRAVRG